MFSTVVNLLYYDLEIKLIILFIEIYSNRNIILKYHNKKKAIE